MNPTSGNSAATADAVRPVVFLVDDAAPLLELNTVILEALGFRVRAFLDPVVAVQAYLDAETRPVLVVTDYAMSGLNGLQLIGACRRAHPTQKFLLLSGTVDESISRHAPEKPDGFLRKPYQRQQLADVVQALVAA